MQKIYLSFLLLLLGLSANAQLASSYVFAQVSNESLSSMASSTELVAASQDDVASAVTSIGFDLWFMGTRYTQFSVSDNGAIRLGGTVISGITVGNSFPLVGQQILAPYYGDYATSPTGKVHYTITGSAPNRVLTVEWLNMEINYSSTTIDGTFQARIHETTGKIDYVYGAMKVNGITTASSQVVKIGFCNTNTANNVFSVNQASFATDNTSSTAITNTNGSINAAISNINSASDGSRIQFSFLSATPTVPSGLSFSNLTSSSYNLNWTDNASNEVGYVLYRSTDNVTYTFNKQVAANSTSTSVTGLTAGTLYYWKVYAITEGSLSSSLDGNQTTLAAKNWIGAGAGGAGTDFNTGTNWNPAGVPGATDEAIITTTGTVTIALSADATIGGLTILNNSTANFTLALDVNTRTLTVNGDLTGNINALGAGTTELELRVGNSPGNIVVVGNTFLGNNGNTLSFVGFGGSGAASTSGDVTFKGNVTFGETYYPPLGSITIGRFIWDGTGAQTIFTNASYHALLNANVLIGNTNTPTVSVSTTTASNLLIAAAAHGLTINTNSTLNLNSHTFNKNVAGGTLTLNAGSKLQLSATTGGQTGSNFPLNFTAVTPVLNATSTVEYNGTGAQTIFAGVTYGHLTLTNNSTKSATAALTIAGNLTNNTTNTFAAGTSLTHNVGGNWVNNGTFSFTTANTLNFNGNNALQTISGSSTTGFYNVIVNKGTANTNILDVTSLITLGNPVNPLTITNGTFKLSSASAIVPFTTGAGATITSTGGFVNNGGTVTSGNFSWTNNGLLANYLGTTTIGTNAGNSLNNSSTSTCDIQGGTLNIASKLVLTGATFTQSGGTVNLNTVANASGTGSFEATAAANINITNGTLVFRFKNSVGNDMNIVTGAGTKTITGGTFQIGDASTPAAQTFLVNSAISLFNFTINTTNAPSITLVTNNLTLSGTLTMNGGNIDGATNSKDIVITNGASGAISRTSGFINFNLKRSISNTAVSYLFPVGFSTNYTPADLTFTNLTAGNLNILAVNGDESNLVAGSGIDGSVSVNSHWQLSASGGLVSTNYVGTLTYPSALNDNVGQVANYIVGKNNSGWTYPAVSGTPTTTSTLFTSASGFGNLAIGQCKVTPAAVGGSNQDICNLTTNLAATAVSSPASGSWSIISGAGGSFGDNASATSSFTGTAGSVYVLRWTVGYSGSSCGTNTADVTISLVGPTASAGGSVTSSVGEYNTVAGASATNGTILWTHDGAGYFDTDYFTDDETTLIPTYYTEADDFGQTVTLTMTVTGIGGCTATTATANYTITVNGNPALWTYQCGTTVPYVDEYIYAYDYPGATQYRYRINDGTTSQTLISNASLFYFREFPSFLYNTAYNIDVSVFVGGSWGAYGPICQITTPDVPTTQIRALQCGATLAALNTTIYADQVWGITDYEFKVFDGVATQNFQTTNRYFSLTDLATYDYNKTYAIEVRVRYNAVWEPYGPSCNVTSPLATTNLIASQCGITLGNITTDVNANDVYGATEYRFRLVNGGTTLTIDKPSRTFKCSQVSGIQYSTTYTVDVAVKLNGSWTTYGATCNLTTPAISTTQLRAIQCGVTASSFQEYIYADEIVGATQYRFRLINGGTTLTYDSPGRFFSCSQISGIQGSTTYNVTVAVYVNGSWGAYGAVCTLTTPVTVITTQVRASQCGITLTSMFTDVYADAVTGVTQYRFRLYDGVTYITVTNSYRSFRCTQFPTIKYATIYAVDVAVFVNGSWQDYGADCNLTTQALPTTKVRTTQCNTTLTSINDWIYADEVFGATQYKFKVSKVGFLDSVTSSGRFFRMSQLSGLAINTVYNVNVQIYYGGQWKTYGSTCTITTPNTLSLALNDDLAAMEDILESGTELTALGIEETQVNEYEVLAFPNPFTSTFSLSSNSSNQETYQIKIYDMTGKLIENIVTNELENLSFGEKYQNGIYTLSLQQGKSLKVLKVVKQ